VGKVIRRHWDADSNTGLARRDRRSCDYAAYVPDTLAGREILLSGETAADAADAERAIAMLEAQALTLVDIEALARILLRAESVASSRIEGLEVGARRLLRAEAAIELGERPSDVTATEVLGNIDAIASAIRNSARVTRSPSSSCWPFTVGCSPARGSRPMRVRSAPSKTGSAEAATTPVPPPSFRRRRSTCPVSWTTSACSAAPRRSRPSCRLPWHTLSSRPFTRSLTATAGPAGLSSTWFCAAAALPRASYRRSRSCSQPGPTTTSSGCRRRGTVVRHRLRPRGTAWTYGSGYSRPHADEPWPTQSASRTGPSCFRTHGGQGSDPSGRTRLPTFCCVRCQARPLLPLARLPASSADPLRPRTTQSRS